MWCGSKESLDNQWIRFTWAIFFRPYFTIWTALSSKLIKIQDTKRCIDTLDVIPSKNYIKSAFTKHVPSWETTTSGISNLQGHRTWHSLHQSILACETCPLCLNWLIVVYTKPQGVQLLCYYDSACDVMWCVHVLGKEICSVTQKIRLSGINLQNYDDPDAFQFSVTLTEKQNGFLCSQASIGTLFYITCYCRGSCD